MYAVKALHDSKNFTLMVIQDLAGYTVKFVTFDNSGAFYFLGSSYIAAPDGSRTPVSYVFMKTCYHHTIFLQDKIETNHDCNNSWHTH